MPKYIVSMRDIYEAFVVVEAENADKAAELAIDMVDLDWQPMNCREIASVSEGE